MLPRQRALAENPDESVRRSLRSAGYDYIVVQFHHSAASSSRRAADL